MATKIRLSNLTQPLDQDLSVPSITSSGNISLADSAKVMLGDDNNTQVYHNGTHTYFDNYTGNLYFNNYSNDKNIQFATDDGTGGLAPYVLLNGTDGSVILYHYGTQRLQTSNTGVSVSGDASISGDLTVSGDFLVSGNTTTLNVDTLAIEDLNITLANGAANSSVADGAGITIDGASATLTYSSGADAFTTNKSLEIVHGGNSEVTLKDTSASANSAYIGGINWDNASYDNVVRVLGFNDDTDIKGGKFQVRVNNLDSTPTQKTRIEVLNGDNHTYFYPSYVGDVKSVSLYSPSSNDYNLASYGDVDKVVSGIRFNWYTNYWQIGAERSGGTDIQSLTIHRDGILRTLISRSGQHQIHANNTAFAAGGAGTLRIEEKEDGIPSAVVFKSVATNSGVGNTGAIWFDAGADGTTANNRLNLSARHQEDLVPAISIDGNSNVGMGTTSPLSRLHIEQTTGVTNTLYIAQQKTYGAGTGTAENSRLVLSITEATQNAADREFVSFRSGPVGETSSSDAYLAIGVRQNGALVDRLYINHNGNIGLGETDPDAPLHLSGTQPTFFIQDTSGVSNDESYGAIKWRSSNNNINAKIEARQESGTSGGRLAFYTRTYADGTNTDGGEERLVIDHNGKIWAYGNVDTGNYAINGLRQRGAASPNFTANSYYYLCSTNSSYNGASSGFDVTIHDTERTRSVVVSVAVKNAGGTSSANGTVYGSGVSGMYIIGYRQADNYTTHYYIKNTNGVSYTPRWAVSNMVGDSYIESSPPTTGITETFSIDCGVAFFGNRVGIGETAPLGKLHVKDGDAGAITTNNAHDTVIVEGSDNTGINIFSPSTSYQYLAFGDPTSSNAGYVRYYHAGDQMVLRAGQADTFRVEANKASINQAPSDEAFAVAKTATDSYTANAYNDKSTLALKAQAGVDEYASIRFSNTTGSYEFFLGTTQDASDGTATMRWQGYDRGAGVYKEFATLSDSGQFTAVSKSFDIEHPTKEGMRLHHGSLEGPEHGVYVRGRLKDSNVIVLPDYWTGLVHEDTITVQLTAIGGKQNLWVEDIIDNTIIVGCEAPVNCFYFVQAERKDIDRFDVEYEEV